MSAVERFTEITKFDIVSYFTDFNDFVFNHYPAYLGYYLGENELNTESVNLLNKLFRNSTIIEELFDNNKNQLSEDIDALTLYEDFYDSRIKLETIINSPKWTRSSYVNDYDRNINIDYILKQNQNIEALATELGYPIPDDDWVQLAVTNKLKENDYTLSGGTNLKVTFNVNNRINTESVVDIMVENNLLGRDLSVDTTFESDDFKALEPLETLKQSAEILIGMPKGAVPEFPEDGVAKDLIGTNLNSIQYPILFRQQAELFANDDTFNGIELRDISRDRDGVILSFTITSKLNNVLEQTLQLNG